MRSLIVLPLWLITACGSADSASPQPRPTPASTKASAAPVVAAATLAAVQVGTMSKGELAAKICFLTPAEIEAALGFKVAAGEPQLQHIENGKAGCNYIGSDNGLLLYASWIDPPQVAEYRAYFSKMSAGVIEPLPGDPDVAYWQDQGELGGSLHYLRGNIEIEVRTMKWSGDKAAIKASLLRLRRGP